MILRVVLVAVVFAACGKDRLRSVPEPPACGAVAPTSLDFGAVLPGARLTQTTRVSSCGEAELHIDSARIEGSTAFTFAFTAVNVPFTLGPGGASVDVLYAPTLEGDDVAELILTSPELTDELRVTSPAAPHVWPPKHLPPVAKARQGPNAVRARGVKRVSAWRALLRASVACDGAGFCRGVLCGTGAGPVTDVTLQPITDVSIGATGAVAVNVDVTGERLCGLGVTVAIQQDTVLYTSAAHDGSVWKVDLVSGERHVDASGLGQVNGLATDSVGNLYVVACSGTCEVGTLRGSAFTAIASVPFNASRLVVGNDAALYVGAGLEVLRVDLFSSEVTVYGDIPDGVGAFGSGTFITGLAFRSDGTLIVGEHWPLLFAVAPGGGRGTEYARGPDVFVAADDPWHEGLVFGPNGLLYVGVFPTKSDGGLVYRVNADGSTEVVVDHTRMIQEVSSVEYAGIHGIAFGINNALYFTNQNTSSDTREPVGQLLVHRPEGTVELVAEGFNFDWMNGFDGDLVLGHALTQMQSVAVASDGAAGARLDAPSIAGPFQVIVYVTDPETGQIFTATQNAAAH